MNKDFMKKAIQLSQENMQKGAGGPFGAVIVKNGSLRQTILQRMLRLSLFVKPARASITLISQEPKSIRAVNLARCVCQQSIGPALIRFIMQTPAKMLLISILTTTSSIKKFLKTSKTAKYR
jgi:hypothetical protein